MITVANHSTRSQLDRETWLMLLAQEATCRISERERRESLARVRRNLLASLAVFAEGAS